jgi:AbrB family looped-hinge helix DNA binding protein
MKYYGDTVIGEKGQIVVPAEMRKKFGIETGDRFLVLAGEKMGTWGLILVKAEVLSRVFNEFFGGRLDEVLAQNSDAKERTSTLPHE